jgi:hypothetical protein
VYDAAVPRRQAASADAAVRFTTHAYQGERFRD